MEKIDRDQLNRLHQELTANLMAYDSETQEEFVQLLVESLKGKGNPVNGEPILTRKHR